MVDSNQKPGANLTLNELIVITVPKSLARFTALVSRGKKMLRIMKLLRIKLEEKCEMHALDFGRDALFCCYEFKPEVSSLTHSYLISV